MKTIFYKSNMKRDIKFQISTSIIKDKNIYIEKRVSNNLSKEHLRNLISNEKLLASTICDDDLLLNKIIYSSDNVVKFEYINSQSMYEFMIEILKKNEKLFIEEIDKYFYFLNNSFETTKENKEEIILESFDTKKFNDFDFNYFKVTNLDMSFDNIFIKKNKKIIIDYEWVFNFRLPTEYIFYRSVKIFFNKLKKLGNNNPIFEFLIEKYSLHNKINLFEDIEEAFQIYVYKKDKLYDIKNSKYKKVENISFLLDNFKNQIEKMNRIVIEKSDEIRKRDKIIVEKSGEIRKRDKIIVEKSDEIRKRDKIIVEKSDEIRKRDKIIVEKSDEIRKRDSIIREDKKTIDELRILIYKYESRTFNKIIRLITKDN